MIKGFEPVFDAESKVLILGSFPSVKSRQVGFYYGNPQNRFWRVLEKAFNQVVPTDAQGKVGYLLRHGIALWDIIVSADIVGSSDEDLTADKSEVGDINSLIKNMPKLKLIICNGKKSYAETLKALKTPVSVICLPSTSPRNVSFDESKWIKALSNY